MKFDVPKVRACLMKNQEVYTVRAFESHDRFTVVPVNNLPDCLKEKICKIESYKDLTRYTHLSGFKSPLEWWRKIEEMKATEGWLYRVSVLEVESFDSPSSEPSELISHPCDQDFNSPSKRCHCDPEARWPKEVTVEFLKEIGCHCPESVLACKDYF